MARRKPFYGWLVVGTSAALLALGLGMYNSTNSVFVKPICDSLGFARGEFTLHRTIITLVGALLMPVYGGLIQRIGVRRVLLFSSVLLGAVTLGYSFAKKLWHFYALAAINGVFYNGVGFMTVGILVNDWFDGKKGLALGLAYSGSGLGGAIMVPVVSRVIVLAGWQWAYRLMAALGVAVMLPVVLLLVRDRPAQLGLHPLAADGPSPRVQPGESGLSLREALRTGRFWMLIAAFALINAFASATNTHSAPYLSDLGYSVPFVSSVVSLFMLFLTLGKIALGLIYDRAGALTGNILIAVLCLGYPVCALLARLHWMPWVYAVFVGLASCGVSVPVTILIGRYFGGRDFPALFSFTSMISSLAASASVPAMGAIYDVTGSYRLAWQLLLILSAGISACLIGAELAHRARGKELP